MITQSSCFGAARAFLILAVTVTAAHAVPITLESVPQDAVDQTRAGGYVVAASQFMGWRFEVDQPFDVTGVGGNFTGSGGSGELFAVLISLSGPNAVPLGSPFLSQEVIAATTFRVSATRADVLVPLSVTLMPGVYGLVFGSGAFGADGGQSAMSYLTGNPLMDPGYFFWDTNPRSGPPIGPYWVGSSTPTRFVVVGGGEPVSAVPDSSLGLAEVLPLIVMFAWGLNIRLRRTV